jgi:hypothetical protein
MSLILISGLPAYILQVEFDILLLLTRDNQQHIAAVNDYIVIKALHTATFPSGKLMMFPSELYVNALELTTALSFLSCAECM